MLVPPLSYYKELATKKSTKEKNILLNNFENAETEGTEIDLENTAEAPIEVVEIAGNTTQNGEPSLENEVEVEGVSGEINYTDNIAEKELENQYRNNAQKGSIIQENSFNSYIAKIKPNKNYLIKNGHSNICLFDNNMQYITGYSNFQEKINTKGINNVAFITVAVEQSKESTFSILEEFRGETEISLKNKNQLSLEDVAETTYVEAQEQLHTFSLGDLILYGDENARDVFNVTIDQDFYEKTGYRKITSLDLVKKWKKYILDGTNNKFNQKSSTLNNNIFITNTISDILKPKNNNSIIKSYCNYFNGNFSVNNVFLNNRIGYGISNAGTLQFGFGLESDINTLELANAKLQELNTAGHPLYVIYQLETPETENITDNTLINNLENFINNVYTYKEKTSITSKLFLKLKYKKDKYYDLENRVKALEEANNG